MSPTRDAVFITGAAGGIGRATIQLLIEKGFHVVAGVKTGGQVESFARPRGPGRIIPMQIDVTNPRQIRSAADETRAIVERNGWQLRGLVNGAAHENLGPLEIIPAALFRREMEVGLFGALDTTRAFLPLLRESQGRIVNISSIHGLVAVPDAGSSCIAKRSLEAMSDVLRLELAPWGIRVVLINPGATATPLWEKTQLEFEQLKYTVPEEDLKRYHPDWSISVNESRMDTQRQWSKAAAPERVAAAIHRALTASRPRVRYVVGRNARWLYFLSRLLPSRWLDVLNRGHCHRAIPLKSLPTGPAQSSSPR